MTIVVVVVEGPSLWTSSRVLVACGGGGGSETITVSQLSRAAHPNHTVRLYIDVGHYQGIYFYSKRRNLFQ